MHAMTEQRTSFTDLVRQRRAELGLSVRKLADLCIDPETGERPFKFGWIGKVENGEVLTAPGSAYLRALAAGLSMPLRIVQEAVAVQYLGMAPEVWSQDRTTRLLAARIEEMSAEERLQMAEIAETFARRKTQRNGGVRE
jgi:transcriptional regulator with XRE-family HTH domain